MVNQTCVMSSPFHKTGVSLGAQTQLQGRCIYTLLKVLFSFHVGYKLFHKLKTFVTIFQVGMFEGNF